MPDRYVPMAPSEEQCRAIVGACGAAAMQISLNPEMYDRVLAREGKTALELQGLYTSIVLYVSDKLEGV